MLKVSGTKFFILLILVISLTNSVHSKVDPPNYNFSLDSLAIFYPGKKLADIPKEKFGTGESVIKEGEKVITKFYVAHIRYKFPIFVQTINGEIVDFMARLPSYFLHDVFHQSLINRYGKQDQYFKQHSNAVYIWNNKDSIRFTYEGACTINCFPIYLSAMKFDGLHDGKPFESILKKLKFPPEK